MAVGQSANAYIGHLAQSLATGGAESVFYVDKITSLTGETLSTADFSIFGKGTITIDPLSTTNIEFCSFTAVDGTNIAFTGGVRGLSAFDYTASTSRAKYHPVGTTVIIAFGVHNLLDLVNYVAGQVAGQIGTATNSISGSTKLSVAAVSAPNPIAVGDNDPRVMQYTVDTGSANAYAIAPSPAIAAYAAGQFFTFKATHANTTASTLAVNGLTAIAIKKQTSVALASGDILLNQIITVFYDGTNFQLISPQWNGPTYNSLTGQFASGVTTHDVSVTGGGATQTIAHGLGVIPKMVRITVTLGNTTTYNFSVGTYIGSTTSCVFNSCDYTGTATDNCGTSSYILNGWSNCNNGYEYYASIATDGTNITLTWLKAGTPTGTANILWEAFS